MAADVLSVRQTLTAHPLFRSCSPAQLDRLSRLGTALEVAAGYVLTRAGRRGYELFLVLDGTASCEEQGRRRQLVPGDHFGSTGRLGGEQASATVTATSEMRLLAIDTRELNAALALDGTGAHPVGPPAVTEV